MAQQELSLGNRADHPSGQDITRDGGEQEIPCWRLARQHLKPGRPHDESRIMQAGQDPFQVVVGEICNRYSHDRAFRGSNGLSNSLFPINVDCHAGCDSRLPHICKRVCFKLRFDGVTSVQLSWHHALLRTIS